MRTIASPVARGPIVAVWLVVVAAWTGSFVCAAEPTDSFRDVLELSEVKLTTLAQIAHEGEPSEADWPILLNVLYRLQQTRHEKNLSQQTATDPKLWLADAQAFLGQLTEVSGKVLACERVVLPERLAKLHELPALFRCQFRFSESEVDGIVYTRHRPARWENRESLDEPVRFRGAILKIIAPDDTPDAKEAVLLLTDHLQWFPTQKVSAGQLLLARHGMDVSLLEEVRHRRPFVKPQVSREGEAFYACLTTLKNIDLAELTQQARQSVEQSEEKWQSVLTKTTKQLKDLRHQMAEAKGTAEKKELQQRISDVRQRATLADLILQRAAKGRSSVAPLLIQPEKETGQLLLIQGIARRAVRIVVENQRASFVSASEPVSETEEALRASPRTLREDTSLGPAVAGGRKILNNPAVLRRALKVYYEVEVFTPHANKLQNLPVVCCVAELPDGFPQGDQIREPVRLAGVFFKSWVYAARGSKQSPEAGGKQQRVFAPVVLGRQLVWIRESSTSRNQSWKIWGGVAFLLGLAILWVVLAWLARRDRLSRKTLFLQEEMPDNPWNDAPEDGSS